MGLNLTSRYLFRLSLTGLLIATVWLKTPTANGAEPDAAGKKTVRLLTIGNSFSRNATRYLDKLVTAGGHELIHRPIVVGGASMELHANKAAQHEANPDDKAGRYADGSSLKERLKEQPWDFVTIQQASRLSPDVNSYRPFAAQLRDYIKTHAPQSRLMIHQTWAYRCDDPWFVNPPANSKNPVTQEEMYNKLNGAYFTIATELEAGVIPVGNAFQLATLNEKWKYRPDTTFDFSKAKYPELPDQRYSLHTGWQWRTQKSERKLSIDGHHANAAGEYLGSCVFYEVLFDDDVRKNSFVPEGIDPQFAQFLRETAHEVAAESKDQKP